MKKAYLVQGLACVMGLSCNLRQPPSCHVQSLMRCFLSDHPLVFSFLNVRHQETQVHLMGFVFAVYLKRPQTSSPGLGLNLHPPHTWMSGVKAGSPVQWRNGGVMSSLCPPASPRPTPTKVLFVNQSPPGRVPATGASTQGVLEVEALGRKSGDQGS